MIGDNVLERQLHALLFSGEVTDSNNYEAVVAAAKSFGFGALSRLTRREYQAFLRRSQIAVLHRMDVEVNEDIL